MMLAAELALAGVGVAIIERPPDHVGWVGDGTDVGLADALASWFGPPAG
jgi:hypothetical protein